MPIFPLRHRMDSNAKRRSPLRAPHGEATCFEPLEPRVLLSAVSLDPVFGEGGLVRTGLEGSGVQDTHAIIEQADGRIISVMESSSGVGSTIVLARHNANGTLDESFGVGGRATSLFGDGHYSVSGAVLDSQGGVIVAASFRPHDILLDPALTLMRFTAEGELDTTFGSSDGRVTTRFGYTSFVPGGIELDAQGRIVIAATAEPFRYVDTAVARFLPDGTADLSFGNGGVAAVGGFLVSTVYDLAIDDLGQIVVSAETVTTAGGSRMLTLMRFTPGGAFDTTFGANGMTRTNFGGSSVPWAIDFDHSGNIIVGGEMRGSVNDDFLIARFTSNGLSDSTFGVSGGYTRVDLGNTFEKGYDLEIAADGKLLLGGYSYLPLEGQPQGGVVIRFTSEGLIDTTFNHGRGSRIIDLGSEWFQELALAADGDILLGGVWVAEGADNGDAVIVRLTPEGDFEADFNGGWIATDFLRPSNEWIVDLVQAPDGKLVAVGTVTMSWTAQFFTSPVVVRYHADGTLDTSFGGGDGVVYLNPNPHDDEPTAVAVDADGSIIVGGNHRSGGVKGWVMRLTAAGDVDTAFANNGTFIPSDWSDVTDLTIDGQGRIVVGGFEGSSRVIRLTANGQLDTTFGGGDGVASMWSVDVASAVLVDPQGRIVLTGYGYVTGNTWDVVVARLLDDGSIDASFGGGDGWVLVDAGLNDEVRAMTLDRAGRIVVAGLAHQESHRNPRLLLARITDAGVLDSSFAANGLTVTALGVDAHANDVAVDDAGRIVVFGQRKDAAGNWDAILARYTDAGTLDTTVDADGIIEHDLGSVKDRALAGIIDANGRMIIAGATHRLTSGLDLAMARYVTTGVAIEDAQVLEGQKGKIKTTDLAFTVRLSEPLPHPVTVRYHTANGTALADSDYRSISGTLTFAAGQTTQTVTVQVLRDGDVESDETFYVRLTDPSDMVLSDREAVGLILNDDTGEGKGGGKPGKGTRTQLSAESTFLTVSMEESTTSSSSTSSKRNALASGDETLDLLALLKPGVMPIPRGK